MPQIQFLLTAVCIYKLIYLLISLKGQDHKLQLVLSWVRTPAVH